MFLHQYLQRDEAIAMLLLLSAYYFLEINVNEQYFKLVF